MLEDLKTLTGESDDKILSSLLLRAKNIILTETNRSQLTPALEGMQLEVALELFNRQGSEGETSRSEGGVSVSYKDGLSDTILNGIRSHRLARVAGRAFEAKPAETIFDP